MVLYLQAGAPPAQREAEEHRRVAATAEVARAQRAASARAAQTTAVAAESRRSLTERDEVCLPDRFLDRSLDRAPPSSLARSLSCHLRPHSQLLLSLPPFSAARLMQRKRACLQGSRREQEASGERPSLLLGVIRRRQIEEAARPRLQARGRKPGLKLRLCGGGGVGGLR